MFSFLFKNPTDSEKKIENKVSSKNKIDQIFDEYIEYTDNVDFCLFWLERHPTEKNKLWVFLRGEKGTNHEKGLYKAEFTIPDDYPKIRPEGKFLEPLPYHCNIGSSGQICILNFYNDWNQNYQNRNFNKLMECLTSFMSQQNSKNPYRGAIAKQQIEKPLEFEQEVKKQALVCYKAFS